MRPIKRHHPISFVALAAFVGAIGCRSMSADLEPARTAEAAAGEDAAQSSAGNVTVIASAEEWPGEAYITEEVTPLHVTVRNGGDQPLRVRYDDFALMAPNGIVYQALPPLDIEGEVPVSRNRARIYPGFDGDGFDVAQPYVTAYPTLSAYHGPFVRDPYYYDTFYSYWDRDERLPTPEMIYAALPEGVVRPGGHASGWLYFQKVDVDDVVISFRADLKRPDDARVADLSIPFRVD